MMKSPSKNCELDTQKGMDRQEPIIIDKRFAEEKRKLHELYKLVKAGLISPDDINSKQKRLLRRYYGVQTRAY